MVEQYFNCPDCGKPIAFDEWEDIFDTCVDTLGGEYIEYAAYSCSHCGAGDITAKVRYSLKFQKYELI